MVRKNIKWSEKILNGQKNINWSVFILDGQNLYCIGQNAVADSHRITVLSLAS